ncbi:MAG: hypothetical protein ABSF00_13615 [Candidatus Bathyarchaeia archaeon]
MFAAIATIIMPAVVYATAVANNVIIAAKKVKKTAREDVGALPDRGRTPLPSGNPRIQVFLDPLVYTGLQARAIDRNLIVNELAKSILGAYVKQAAEERRSPRNTAASGYIGRNPAASSQLSVSHEEP